MGAASIRLAVKLPQASSLALCLAMVGNVVAHFANYGLGGMEGGFLFTRILHMVSFTGFFVALIALVKQGRFAAPAEAGSLPETG